MEYIVPIIIAVLSLVGTLSGSYFANKRSTALITYRIEQLEKKIVPCETLDARIQVLETKVEAIQQEIKELKNKK